MSRVQAATQVQYVASAASSITIVLPSVVGGNTIIATASIWHNLIAWSLTNVTDGGNLFTTRTARARKVANTDQSFAVLARADNVTGGSRTVAFNLASTTSVYAELGCWEWSGLAPATPEDTFDANEDVSTAVNDITAGPITTTDAGDVLFGAATVNSGDSTLNLSSPTSWTNDYRQNDSNNTIGFDAGYWEPGAIQTTYTAQWTHDNTAGNVAGGLVIALKPAKSLLFAAAPMRCLLVR